MKSKKENAKTKITSQLKNFQLHQIPRTENAKTDYLAKLANSMVNYNTRNITIRTLIKNPPEHNIMTVQIEIDWRRPLLDYLEKNIFPPDEKEASRLKHRATREEDRDILQEIHEDACRSHVARWALANKTLRAGYFLPTFKRDATSWAKGCKQYQQYSPLIHVPAKPLRDMSSPCPFSQWGMDIVRPFPIAMRKRKFLLVAVDYFSKWIEAEPLA
ncbi:UNVERIFIED_CONTAM: hypothetical protein Sradi_3320500 [Sesamum radiatum]|uniref:Integrase catalytic domain-containing protein n=1 Tax=Sesamum radiatum TaxID=300843 RepID=A0AAW2R2M5_SESRA